MHVDSKIFNRPKEHAIRWERNHGGTLYKCVEQISGYWRKGCHEFEDEDNIGRLFPLICIFNLEANFSVLMQNSNSKDDNALPDPSKTLDEAEVAKELPKKTRKIQALYTR